MKILFLTHYFHPHIGGVEKHIYKLSLELIKKGHIVTVVTEKYDKKLKNKEIIDGINIIRIDYPKIKFLGLLFIWLDLLRITPLILQSDIVHIHDVFIWYLPFRFLFFWKKVFITIHGYEPNNPFLFTSLLQKRLAIKFSGGSIGVGKYLEKYMKCRFDFITYGAADKLKISKKKKQIVFIGRLSEDTGVLQFLNYLKKHRKIKVLFLGDGEYKKECMKYGKVYGFINPSKFLKESEYVVPGGYLSCLEAMASKCKIKIFYTNKLKKDYWELSPMYKFIKNKDVEGAYRWVEKESWDSLADDYIKLWNQI